MRTSDKPKRRFQDTGWYSAGVGILILSGVSVVAGIVFAIADNDKNADDKTTEIEVARLEACGTIEDEMLLTLCVNGIQG